jgi:hypothetical protein
MNFEKLAIENLLLKRARKEAKEAGTDLNV